MTFSGGLGAFLLKIKGLAARSKAKIAEIESSGVLTSAAKKDMTKELSDNKEKAIIDAELYVKFIAKGEVSAKCEWKKDVDDSWLSVEGDKTASASAKITFKLEAVAKAKAEAFCFKISIGAELNVAGAKSSAEGIGIETTLFATPPRINQRLVVIFASREWQFILLLGPRLGLRRLLVMIK
jgi:hypothetical protein